MDDEVEHALKMLRENGGRARIGHKTKPAQGKIGRDVVRRMVIKKLVDVRGSNGVPAARHLIRSWHG